MLASVVILLLGGLLLGGVPRLLNWRELQRSKDAWSAFGDCFPIVMPVTDRPRYLQQVLQGLREVADISKTVLVFTQDERHPEVAELIARCGLQHVHLRHTQPFFGLLARLGLITRAHCIGANIYFGIEAVFACTACRGVVVLEDDLVPGSNFYRHFVWCFEHVMLAAGRAERVLSCGAYNRYAKGQVPETEHDALFCDHDYFSPWSWAIARQRWLDVRNLWSFASWDSAMEVRVMPRLNLVNWRPVHSHVQSIGNHGVNGGRAEGCTFYTTVPVTKTLDYTAMQPRFYEEGLPRRYWEPFMHDQQACDPTFASEWDRKLLPRLWQHLQGALPAERRRAIKRWLPFC